MQPTELPLKDIHLPAAIDWFPPAIGWWCVAIFIPLILYAAIQYYRRYTRQTALKTANTLFITIQHSPVSNAQKLRAVSQLLRRVAMSLSTRQQVASLTGESWLAFLDSSLQNNGFSQGCGRALLDAPYRDTNPSDAQLAEILQLCNQWLRVQKQP